MEEYTEAMYYEMYRLFCLGELSKDDWRKYCLKVLEHLMKRNKDVLERLKEL